MQEILASHPEDDLRVFVVWEPVIATDLAPPTTGAMARLSDRRVAQYWDHRRVLSADIVRALLADPGRYALEEEVDAGTIVWDTVALFPEDARWERDLPVPAFYGAPVAEAAPGLAAALTRAPTPAPGRAPGSGPSTP